MYLPGCLFQLSRTAVVMLSPKLSSFTVCTPAAKVRRSWEEGIHRRVSASLTCAHYATYVLLSWYRLLVHRKHENIVIFHAGITYSWLGHPS